MAQAGDLRAGIDLMRSAFAAQLEKMCSSVRACKFVLDTESDCFIGEGQGSSWITTYGAKNGQIGKPQSGRESASYRSGPSLGFFGGSGGLLRVAEEQEC